MYHPCEQRRAENLIIIFVEDKYSILEQYLISMLFSSKCFPHKSIITIFINKFCNKLNMNLPIFDESIHIEEENFPFECSHSIWEENFITQRKLSRFSFRSVHAMSEIPFPHLSITKKKRGSSERGKNIMKNSFRRMYNSFHTWNIYSIHADMTATTFFSRWCSMLMRLQAIMSFSRWFSSIV